MNELRERMRINKLKDQHGALDSASCSLNDLPMMGRGQPKKSGSTQITYTEELALQASETGYELNRLKEMRSVRHAWIQLDDDAWLKGPVFQVRKILMKEAHQHLCADAMTVAEAKAALSKFQLSLVAFLATPSSPSGETNAEPSVDLATGEFLGNESDEPLTFSEAPCLVQPWDPQQGFLYKFNSNLKLQMKPAVIRNQSPEILRTILEHLEETKKLLSKYEAAVRRAERKANA